MKKTIFMLLFVVLGLQQALAQNFTFGGLNYTVTSANTASVAGNPDISGAITIPADVTNNGTSLSVTSIGNGAFNGCSNLTSLTIPNSVSSIGSNAFQTCSSLTSITIPNSVTSIGHGTFQYCTGLTSVTIPNSVTSIGKSAFSGCSNLSSVTIPNSVTIIDFAVFYECTSLTSVTIPNSVTSIGTFVFYGCTGLTSVTIPNSVTSIGDQAFNSCSSLTSVTIPNSVISIGQYAFSYCSGLTSVTIPNSVTSISDYAFNNCSSLTSVTIGNAVTSIGDGAFKTCTSLSSVTIPNSVTSIGKIAFQNCTGLTSVTIGNSLTSIGDEAFSRCSGLTSVTIPNSLTSIGKSAFHSCSALTSVTIPNSVTSIGQSTFYSCSALTSVTIGNAVTSIGQYTFYNCSSITSVTIGNSVTSIDGYAFYNCSNLTSVTIPNSVNSIGLAAFYNCSGLTSVTIPNSINSIGQHAFYNCSGLTSVTIPNALTSIGKATFALCSGLTSVSIPNLVTSIGQYAFYNCFGLTSVSIPNSVVSIGNQAFLGCKSLTSISIPNSVTIIDYAAFAFCSALTSVTIPNSVTSIGASAFQDCSGLTSVTIPNSVTSIGENAFYKCSNLTSVVCEIETPLSINSNVFQDVNQGACSLTVPAGSIAAYKAADVWKNFCTTLTENTTTVTACNSYTWTNNSQTYTASGTYTGTTTNCVTEKLVLTIISTATDQTNFSSGGLNYVVTSPTTVAVGTNSGASGPIIIPASVSNACFNYTVTSINEAAFAYCTGLTSVTIPSSVTSIGLAAFYGCSGLTSVSIPNSLISIGNHAFQSCTGLTSVTIPNSVTNIGDHAFNGCTGLTSVTIPNLVTSISDYTFAYCTGLTSVTIPNSVTSIGQFAFLNCTGLTSVTIPNFVTNIRDHAFNGCSSITSVTIPITVASIGQYAFYGCANLNSVVCEIETPLSINPTVFQGVNQGACSLTVPAGSIAAYKAADVWKHFAPIFCAPTKIYSENFEGANSWTLNVSTGTNGADNNFFVISENEGGVISPGCSETNNGNKTLHITSVFNPTGGAQYDAGGLCGILFCPETNRRAESPIFSTVGFTNISVNFDFIGGGDGLIDNASIWYNAGSGWSLLTPSLKSPVCGGGKGQWTNTSITLPVEAENKANVRIGFNWTNNDDGKGTDPSFAVDNIIVSCASIENTTTVKACKSYFWTNNSQTYTASGIYTGTTTNCVTEKLNLTIDITPAPTASAQSFCAGKTVANLAATGTDIKWYAAETGGTALTNETALVSGTTYYASQTLNGCESDRTGVVVTVRTLPTPNISGNPIICTGGTKTFDAGTGYASYLWTPNGETTQTITVGAEATFSVTVTDNFGCSGTSDDIQTAFSTASVGLSNLGTSCLGAAQLALSGDVSSLSSVQWYHNATPLDSPINIPLPTVVAGENGTGSASNQFDQPMGITVDADGNVYVADFNNHRIQKWVPGATSGITVAGGNGAGSADNQLFGPVRIVFDAAGNLYVADMHNHRIQKWAPGATSGITVAGGNGAGNAANQLNNPCSVAVDATGNVYVSELENNRIKKWEPNATIGITVAGGHGQGSDANQLNYPFDIDVDGAGNVYVADLHNSRIQKWTPGATQGITVAGGNGAGSALNQLESPFALHIDASETIYIADLSANRVMKWAKGAKEGVVVAGGFQSVITNQWGPAGVFVTNAGEIYVTTNYGYSIQKWESYHQAFTPTTAGSYTAVVTNVHGCTNTTNAVVVTIPTATPGVIAGANTICKSTTVTYSIDPVANATSYQWTLPTGATGTSTSTSISVTFGSTYIAGNLCVQAVNGTCLSATSCLTITPLTSVPATPGIITGPVTIAPNTTKTFTIASVANASSYAWTAPANATLVSGQGTTSATFNFGLGYTTGVITVKANNCIGNSATRSLSLKKVGVSAVRATHCGKTLATIKTAISANRIPGATKYRFEVSNGSVIQTYETANYYFNLTQLTVKPNYNTAYSIKVAVLFDNLWQNYGSACTVTTPDAPLTTKVRSIQCGKTLTFINSAVAADEVVNANMYQFEIRKNDLDIKELKSDLSYTRLTDLTEGAQYGTTYRIRVRYSLDKGTSWSSYGDYCTVITPAAPLTTKVRTTQCGNTLAFINSALSVDEVVNANKYQFKISKDDAFVEVVTSTTYYTRLTDLIARAQYGTTYRIQVRYSLDNGASWSNYGASCSVTTPAAPLTTKVRTTQCGKTLAFINSALTADEVVNANKYQFKISKDDVFIEDVTSTTYYTRLTDLIVGAQYGTTYRIQVRYSLDNGASWSDYGIPCNVITPSAQGLAIATMNSPEVSVYPNPFSSTFNVATSFEGEVNVKIIDNIGKLIEQFDIDAGELASKEFGQEYVPGMYQVTVTQDMNAKNFKVVKSN